MIEYRKALPGEKGKCIDFINMIFSMAHEPHDFMALIPKTYGADSCMEAEHYLAVEDGYIWGLVALLEEELTVAGTRIRTGVIGSVSAHPYARGKGYMKKCMELALADAREKELQLLFLGGKRQRYEYFGFTPGGVAMDFELREDNFRHAAADVDATPFTFVPIEPYVQEAFRLYAAEPVHANRTVENFAQICATWSGQGLAILKNGQFAGYLAGNISELCLVEESDCLAVLKAWHIRKELGKVEVSVPMWKKDRIRTLAKIASDASCGPIEMFSLMDIETNLRAWLTLKAACTRLLDGEFVFAVEGTTYRVAVQSNAVTVEKTDAAPQKVFTHMELQDFLLASVRWVDTDDMPLCVENWFPLPLFCFSVDGF